MRPKAAHGQTERPSARRRCGPPARNHSVAAFRYRRKETISGGRRNTWPVSKNSSSPWTKQNKKNKRSSVRENEQNWRRRDVIAAWASYILNKTTCLTLALLLGTLVFMGPTWAGWGQECFSHGAWSERLDSAPSLIGLRLTSHDTPAAAIYTLANQNPQIIRQFELYAEYRTYSCNFFYYR